MGGREWCRREVVPFSAVIAADSISVGVTTLFKSASSRGMSTHVFLVYSYAFASLLLLPARFFSLKSRELPPLSLAILAKIGLLGLVGGSSQIFGYAGVSMSSPALGSAISNLTPALTFIFAILFRMEEVSLNKRSSQAKIVGTVLSICGTSVITLYRGPLVIFTPKPSLSLYPLMQGSNSNWVVGGILLTADYILLTLWYILLKQIMKEYPAELTVIFFYNVVVSFMTAIVCLVMEHDMSAWRVQGIELASVICSGLFNRCLTNIVHTWAIRLKGPFYVAMFKPLLIPVAVAMGVFFLGDKLHLGSLIGATILSIGFYIVMWGKAKEEVVEESVESRLESPSFEKVPLLQ
ncbi:WAT1-related protein At3g28050-like isoform X2 [Rhodamnia argentea]|uniref:WAT1-related protein n=1 Tax=Rhodamnia argentea TaxID=178133 RepID=A0ABM3HSQ5_9MYRT|nr:WAT1-related protein At3g28050-like isoform X2 [Rhodamnia argentea]